MNEQIKGASVFVIFGRNLQLRAMMFKFLEAVGLRPLNWQALMDKEAPASHNFAIVANGIRNADVVIALLSGDEDAALRAPYFKPGEDTSSDLRLQGQAPPNVFIEVGMALAIKFDKTLLVRFGPHKEVSDLNGLNYFKIEGRRQGTDAIVAALDRLGCSKVRDEKKLKKIDFRHAIPYAPVVPESKAFIFTDKDGKAVARARSLDDFYLILNGNLDEEVFLRHLDRRDYESWFKHVLHDKDLASDAEAARLLAQAYGGAPRKALATQIVKRYRLH